MARFRRFRDGVPGSDKKIMVRATIESGDCWHDVVSRSWPSRADVLRLLRPIVLLSCALLIGWGGWAETRSAGLEARLFAGLDQGFGYSIEPGPSSDVHFPTYGPYDRRLGYVALPHMIATLREHHFKIVRQAALSPRLNRFIADGGYAVYRQKIAAGFTLLNDAGNVIYGERFPQRIYKNFAAIPPLVVKTLLFIEDRHILDPQPVSRDPAVDWPRFLLATASHFVGALNPAKSRGGASTLATQMEKFRHSPGGRTTTYIEKLRQMVSAAANAYRAGPNTLEARRRIVAAYLSSIPLAARPGHGEVLGLGDGLAEWFGEDFAAANTILRAPATTGPALVRKAVVYREMLSLLLADRRPSYYLHNHRAVLGRLTDDYLRRLRSAGVIGRALAQAALAAPLDFREYGSGSVFDPQSAERPILRNLERKLGVDGFDRLARLDMSAATTADIALERKIVHFLDGLADPDRVRSLRLVGPQLLGSGDPSRVIYSIVLYRLGQGRNNLILSADSGNAPFDVNSGAKLMLGSTAKLRTLITYLDIVSALYRRYGHLPGATLKTASEAAQDPLTRWATGYLASAPHADLATLLHAAMQRRYSANPDETFFTGGGVETFQNFDRQEDRETPTVETAFEQSINLAFIRLMRDITRYYIARDVPNAAELLADPTDPERAIYLRRYADREARRYLDRFFADYHGRAKPAILDLLASRTRPSVQDLTIVFRLLRPDASAAVLQGFLAQRLPRRELVRMDIARVYRGFAPSRHKLTDLAFIIGVHPLELWVARHLYRHTNASEADVMAQSTAIRQRVYSWLFERRNLAQQNARIRIVLERDAFDDIFQDWHRLGYPFGSLIPSLGTALGSSGDRPDALAQLIGIVLNGGVRQSAADFTKIDFAQETPYETDMSFAPPSPQRVLAPAVAATVEQALEGVVTDGTGVRLHGADLGVPGLASGGKTGTGDNRFVTSDGTHLTSSRVVDRTATFVFFLGDRLFGAITAYVPGASAADYHFTSALPVVLLAKLAPMVTRPPVERPRVQTLVAAANPSATIGATAAVLRPQPPLPPNFQPAAGSQPKVGRPPEPSPGELVTARGWLTRVQSSADGTYVLDLAEGPEPGAPRTVIRLPEPDALPAADVHLRQADANARRFVQTVFLHGAEPDLRPWPLIHRPYIAVTGQLAVAALATTQNASPPQPALPASSWQIAPATQFEFLRPPAPAAASPGA
jgi:membrane peptidoglycan carboxypeptidase